MAAIVAPASRPGRCVLTGSQNLLVSAAVGQSLAGRAARIGLDEWIVAGAYPARYDRDVSHADGHTSTVASCVERDGVMTAHWRDALLALRGA